MSEQARRTITALAEKLDKAEAENAALKEQLALGKTRTCETKTEAMVVSK